MRTLGENITVVCLRRDYKKNHVEHVKDTHFVWLNMNTCTWHGSIQLTLGLSINFEKTQVEEFQNNIFVKKYLDEVVCQKQEAKTALLATILLWKKNVSIYKFRY